MCVCDSLFIKKEKSIIMFLFILKKEEQNKTVKKELSDKQKHRDVNEVLFCYKKNIHRAQFHNSKPAQV